MTRQAHAHGRGESARDSAGADTRGWRRVRWTAYAELLWERFWPLVVPALVVVLVFLVVSWLGAWQHLPLAGRYALLALFAGALLFRLARLREFVLPTSAEVSRRVETASRLEDRPITALADEIALGGDDAFSRALWVEHRRRMSARLKGLTAGAPRPDANRTDPWALRAFAALVAFAAFFFAYGPSGGRVADAFRPATDTAELRTRLDAWISPPAYTRRPPVYLAGSQAGGDDASAPGTIEVPAGSEFFLRFVGDDVVELAYSGHGGESARVAIAPAATIEKASTGDETRQTEFAHVIAGSGVYALTSRGRTVSQWSVAVIPDAVPSISFAEIPTAALSGSLQLSYALRDDYGVVAANAEIRPVARHDDNARPLVDPPDVQLPLPRQRARSGSASVNRDLTQHPWAGSRVSITLKARDDAGQTGSSAPHEMVLPGRSFSDPLALALVEQRRILALDARQARRVADLLDAVSTAPEKYIDDYAAYMAIRIAYRRILSARDDDQLRDVLDLLWETALGVEFGDMSEAERRLREAQEALSEALEEGAGDEEIARLMDELREAMDEYMQMLAREAMENPLSSNPMLQNEMMRTLRQSDLERMMDQIEDLARSGSRDAARQMLSELQRMMDNLRAGRHMQQRQTESNQMNQALDKLSELMRRQQELLDETFRMQQQRNEMRRQDRQGQQQRGQQGQQDKQFLTAEQLRLLLGILGKTSESGKEEKSEEIRRKQAITRSIEALRFSMGGENALDAGGLSEVLKGLKSVAERYRRAFGPDRLRRIDELIDRLQPAPGDGGRLWTPGARHGFLLVPGDNAPVRALPVASGEPDARTLEQLERLLDDLESDSRSSSRSDSETIEQLGDIDREIESLLRRLERPGSPGAGELDEMTADTESLIRRLTEALRPQQGQNGDAGGNQGDQSQNGDRGSDGTSDLLNQLLSMLLNMQQEQQEQQGSDGQQGESGEMTEEEFAEALERLRRQQEALQQELGELGQRLEDLGLDPSEQFGEAQGEMGEAGKRLGEGQPGDATGNQAQALDALRRGVQSMMQQMAGDRQQGGPRDGPGQQGGLDRNRTDPLGRSQQNDGLQDDDGTRIPGEIDAQRAREIMEAIRERLSQPASPRIEKDYLERLLETD